MARRTDGSRPNIMVRIATLSVALGVAVMIVTMAVLSGFERGITECLTAFAAHVQVSDAGNLGTGEPEPFVRDAEAERLLRSIDGFASMDSYMMRGGMVRSGDAVDGLVLKGYDGDGGRHFARWLVEGQMPRTGDSVRYKDVLLSRVTALRLDVGVGDKIEMLFVDGERNPRRDRFAVSGIYSSGMDENDRLLALTDIRNLRRLTGMGDDAVSGYEIRLSGDDALAAADLFADEANRLLLFDDRVEASVAARSIRELYPAIFDWQKTHDVNAAVVIVLMLTVALFNVVSALLILVLERTRTVGLLKAVGMTDGSLRRVFLYRAAFIVAAGLFWGDAVGVGLCLLQKFTHIIKLDPEGYLLSEMPVHICWWHVALLNAGAAAAIIAGLLVPARIVASIRPGEAVRYE